jgi:hypothetical protein
MSQKDPNPAQDALPTLYRCAQHGWIVVRRGEGCVLLDPKDYPQLEVTEAYHPEEARALGWPVCDECMRTAPADPAKKP